MSVESHAVSPDVLSLTMLAIGAAAIYSIGEAANAPQQGRDNVSLQRLLNVLPVDITQPRYDLPVPQHVAKINTHSVNQQPYHPRRWGGHFPGGH